MQNRLKKDLGTILRVDYAKLQTQIGLAHTHLHGKMYHKSITASLI